MAQKNVNIAQPSSDDVTHQVYERDDGIIQTTVTLTGSYVHQLLSGLNAGQPPSGIPALLDVNWGVGL